MDEIITPFTAELPPGISTIPLLRSAYFKDIPIIHLGDGVYQLGWGSKARKLDRSTIDTDSAIGSKLSQNKVFTANILKMGGLPAPIHGIATTKESALNLSKKLTYPVVIKPIDLDRGEGVSVNIRNEVQLFEAFEHAITLSKSKNIIVEKYVDGICHRLFMMNHELLYAVNRLPISVKGDGVKTVSELIDDANIGEEKKAPWIRGKPFPRDEKAIEAIAQCGFDLNSVPSEETWVPLRDIESGRWGGRSEDVTAFIHPSNLDIAIRACKLFELNVVGVDIITTDISKPWYETGAIINEINYAPMIGRSEPSRKYLHTYLDRLIGGNGRIIIEVFIGSDEKTMRKAKNCHKFLLKEGKKCYWTTDDLTLDPSSKEVHFPSNRIADRTQALLLNANVESLILLIKNDELLHSFIPFDKVSKITVVSNDIYSYMDTNKVVSEVDFVKLLGKFCTDKK